MPIKLAENFRAVFYAPFYAAQALGFFACEGIEVELIESANPGDAVAGVLDGTIDVTWGGPMRVDEGARRRSAIPTGVLLRSRRSRSVLSGRLRLRCSVQAGRSAAAASGHGLRSADPVDVPTARPARTGHRSRPARTDAGSPDGRKISRRCGAARVDVVQVFEPHVSMALAEGVGEVLYAASARGPTVYTTFIAARDALARHREGFAAMTRAIGHMQDWLAECGAEDLAAAVAPFYSDLPGEILARALARYRAAGLWARTPAVSRQGFARLADSLLSGGFISRTPIYEDCVDMAGSGG